MRMLRYQQIVANALAQGLITKDEATALDACIDVGAEGYEPSPSCPELNAGIALLLAEVS